MLSETLVWCALGKSGHDAYREGRKAATTCNRDLENAGYEYCFHDGEHVLKIVQEKHAEAVGKFEKGGCSHSLLSGMASLAEKMLSDDPEDRPDDRSIHMMLQKALQNGHDSIQTQDRVQDVEAGDREITASRDPPDARCHVTVKRAKNWILEREERYFKFVPRAVYDKHPLIGLAEGPVRKQLLRRDQVASV
jgi:hypothetical protein